MATSNNQQPTEGAQKVYERLSTDRDQYTQRAEKNATYTIPQLFPKESDDGGTSYTTPYNSIGARGLNNLASKLLLSLLPPGQPFFRLGLDTASNEALAQSGDDQAKDAIEYGLSMMEATMVKYMESNGLRPTLFECIKQLLIAGNALLFLPPLEGGMKCYTLRNYVVERDAVGNVIQIVAKDTLAKGTVPASILSILGDTGNDINKAEKVSIYTHTYLVRGDTLEASTWESYQEVNGQVIAGSEQSYPYGKCPWIPVRFTKKDGESYGRSFVEDYLGDLISLENLQHAINDMAMICAKVLYLVSPSCQTNIKQLTKAENGAFVRGRQEDVVAMQTNKQTDLSGCYAVAQGIEQRLSYCFLLSSTTAQITRDRVTAEEIRYIAQELEDTLGGVYSLLSQELQLPLVSCVFNQMQSNGSLPQINEQTASIEPTIITGVDALGRGHDFANLAQALQVLAQFPDIMQTINQNNLAMRIFTSAQIDATGLVKSPEQLAQEQQAQMEQYAAQQGIDAQAQMAVDDNKAQSK